MVRFEDDSICILEKPLWASCNLGLGWAHIWSELLASRPLLENGRDHLPFVNGENKVGVSALADGDYFMRGRKLASAAGSAAMQSLRLFASEVPPLRILTLVATSHGDPGPIGACAEAGAGRRKEWAQLSAVLSDAVTSTIQEELHGISQVCTVAAACASGIVALDLGASLLRSGQVDVVCVVALDALSRVAYTGFRQAGAMTRGVSRPFDVDRDGMMLSEGAALFAMSTGATAKCLDVGVAAVVEASAQYCDTSHLVEPSSSGIGRTISMAMQRARLQPGEIAGVFWHGTGTRSNDAAEAEAAREVFGRHIPPGTSTKGALGHCMGASGAFNVLAACQSLVDGVLPPTAGLRSPDFGVMPVVSDAPKLIERGPLLVNALGFGGINACAILSGAGSA